MAGVSAIGQSLAFGLFLVCLLRQQFIPGSNPSWLAYPANPAGPSAASADASDSKCSWVYQERLRLSGQVAQNSSSDGEYPALDLCSYVCTCVYYNPRLFLYLITSSVASARACLSPSFWARNCLTSSEVAERRVSKVKRFLPALRKSLAHRWSILTCPVTLGV